MVVILMWLGLSILAALAFAFGASTGYRRGFEEATAQPTQRHDPRSASEAREVREVRLPEDVHSRT